MLKVKHVSFKNLYGFKAKFTQEVCNIEAPVWHLTLNNYEAILPTGGGGTHVKDASPVLSKNIHNSYILILPTCMFRYVYTAVSILLKKKSVPKFIEKVKEVL